MTRTSYTPCQHLMSILCLMYCFGALDTVILDEDNDNEIAIAHAGVGKENNTSSECVIMKDETMTRAGKGKEGEEEDHKAGKGDRVDDDSSAIVKMNGAVTEEVAVADITGDSEKGMPGERQDENNVEGNEGRVEDESDADGPAQAIMEEDRVVEKAKRIAIAISTVAPIIVKHRVGEGHGPNCAKDEKDMASEASCADRLAVTIVEEDRVVKDTERLEIGANTGAPVVSGLEGGENQDRIGNASVAAVVEDTVMDKTERVVIPGSASVPVEVEGKRTEMEGQKDRVDVASTVLGPAIAVMKEDIVMDDVERVAIAGFAGTPADIEGDWGEENEEEKSEGGRDIVDGVSVTNHPDAVALEKDRVMDEAKGVAAFISTGPLVERNCAGGDEEENKTVNEEDRVDSLSAVEGATVIMVEEDRVVRFAGVGTGAVATCAPVVREDGQKKNNVEGGKDRVENEAEEVTIVDVGGGSEVMKGEMGEGQEEQNNKEAENDRANDAYIIDDPLAAEVEDGRVMDESVGISNAVTADTPVVREDQEREGQDDVNAEGDVDGLGDPYATDVPSVTVVEGENVVDEIEEVTGVISLVAPLMQESEGKGGLQEGNEEGEQDSENALATISEGDKVVDLAEEVANTVRDNGKRDGQGINNVEGGESRVDDTSATVIEGDQVENEAEEIIIVDVGSASEANEGEVGEGQEQNNKEADNDGADDVSAIDAPASDLLEDDRVMDESVGISIAVTADTSARREDGGGEGQDDINAESDVDGLGDPYTTDVPSATIVEGENVVDEVEEVTGVISLVPPLMQESEGKGGLQEGNEEGEQDSANALATISEGDMVVDLAEGVTNTVRDSEKGDGQEINNVEGDESRVDDTFVAVAEGDQVENEAEEVTIVDVGGASEVIEGEVGEGQDQDNEEVETDRACDVSAIDAPASVVLEDDRVMDESVGISIAVTDDTSVVREDGAGEGQDDVNAKGDEDVIGDPYATDVPEAEKVVDEVEGDTGVISSVVPLIQEGEEKEEQEEDNEEGDQDSVNALTTTSGVDRVVCEPGVGATSVSADIPVFEESEEG